MDKKKKVAAKAKAVLTGDFSISRKSGVISRVLLIATVSLAVFFGAVLRGGPRSPVLCTLLKVGCPSATIGGTVKPGYEFFKDHFTSNFESGRELSAQLVIYVKGEKVVDLWGSIQNDLPTPYGPDSLHIVFSSTKVLESLSIAMLVDRGYLDYDKPVVHYWPEFGAEGKDRITVKEVMRHEAGLAVFPERFDNFSQLVDLDVVAKHVARQKPEWPKESRMAYHALTRGLIVNEIIRRADPKHRSIGKFVAEEIAKPLGIDFYIGAPNDKQINDRIAPMQQHPPIWAITHLLVPFLLTKLTGIELLHPEAQTLLGLSLDPNSWIQRSMAVKEFGDQDKVMSVINAQLYRSIEFSSANGLGNARALGKVAALLANGGEIDGVRLLSKSTLERMLKPTLAWDASLQLSLNMGDGGIGEFINGTGFFGWGGWGGSMVQWQRKNNVAFSYVMNGMYHMLLGDERVRPIFDKLTKMFP